MILQPMQNRIWSMIKDKAVELAVVPIEIGGIEDHIHLLIGAEPSLTPATFIGQLKGATSYTINRVSLLPRAFRMGRGLRRACLAALPGFDRAVDPEAVHLYLTYQYVPPPRSIFRAARKLPPGHLLTWEAGRLRTRAYWRVPADV